MPKPDPSIRISVDAGAGTVKGRLYPAEAFGGPVGLFRLKVGRAWVRTDAEKYLFFAPDAALSALARESGLAGARPERPALARNQRLRVRIWDDEQERDVPEKCFAASPVFQGPDGRWRVFALTSRGVREFLCDDVEIL